MVTIVTFLTLAGYKESLKNDVRIVTLVTKAYQCANAFYYLGHQCACGCFVTKAASVLMAACY